MELSLIKPQSLCTYQTIKSNFLSPQGISLPMKRPPAKVRSKPKPESFALQISTSRYSHLYSSYLRTEFHEVENLIRPFVRHNFCRDFYLRYPLEGLLRGVCKKLLINSYEFLVFSFFLSQVEWKLDSYIFESLVEVFPNIIHVNEPTNPAALKELSMFLYFSSYSVKEFLNEDVQLIKQQMLKLFPEFEHLQAYWTSSQQTVGQVLNARALNSFFRSLSRERDPVDLNGCVDRILQISPCYDITNRAEKQKEVPSFGFMEGSNYVQEEVQQLNLKIEDENIEDYNFYGDI